jgi:hypothetical protein
MSDYNPIRSVNGVAVKSPSVYKWKLEDLSASNAGRTEDTVMQKNRIGQLVGIELQWNKVSIADASVILQQFNPEYVDVCYLDAMVGDYVTDTFYVGDRSAPLYNGELGLWDNIAFNLVGRSGV